MRTFASGWSWPPGSRVEEKAMGRIWEYLNGFTQFATVLISAIALLFHLRWSRRATALGPTILTTLGDRKSTRLNSSHSQISYAVFCLKKKKKATKSTFRHSNRYGPARLN